MVSKPDDAFLATYSSIAHSPTFDQIYALSPAMGNVVVQQTRVKFSLQFRVRARNKENVIWLSPSFFQQIYPYFS